MALHIRIHPRELYWYMTVGQCLHLQGQATSVDPYIRRAKQVIGLGFRVHGLKSRI